MLSRSWRSVWWFPEGNGCSASVWVEGHTISWCNILPAKDEMSECFSLLWPGERRMRWKQRLLIPLEFSYNYEVTIFLLKWLLKLQYLGTVEEIRAQNNANSSDSNKITPPFAFPKMLSSFLYLSLGSRVTFGHYLQISWRWYLFSVSCKHWKPQVFWFKDY